MNKSSSKIFFLLKNQFPDAFPLEQTSNSTTDENVYGSYSHPSTLTLKNLTREKGIMNVNARNHEEGYES